MLLAGAVGAGLILLAVRQHWAQAVFTPPKPLSPQAVGVSGNDLVPLASALAVAALAGLAAVIATRGVLRRAAGVLLAVARVSGETAPLLFTALNSPYWNNTLNQPMSNLTVTLFNYAMSPYDDWHAKAWGAALLITASVLFVPIFTRIILRDRSKR